MSLSSVGLGGPAQAHHSFAMFDSKKVVTLKGVVQKVEYKNPHIFLFVEVADGSGKKVWAIECGSVQNAIHAGWKINTVKAGDAVTAVINPLRNGQLGGSINKVTLASGRVLE